MNQNQTKISTIVQGLIAINVILMGCGITTFENVTADMWYAIISLVAMVAAWAWGVWKNHNFSKAMVRATKAGRKAKQKLKEHDATLFDRLGMVGDGNDD